MAINPLAIGGGVVATAAVVGGGLYAGGVFSGGDKSSGNTGNEKPEIVKEDWEVGMASWHSLSQDNGYDTGGYTSKYGETHKKYLVGVAAKAQGTDANANDAWWKWVYENRFPKIEAEKAALNDKFSTVTSAITTNDKSLKEVCKAAYKEELGSDDNKKIVTTKPETKDENKFLEEHIWLFCSPAKQKIKAISDESNGAEFTSNNTTVYVEINKAKKDLVSTASTTSKGNKWFWYQKSEEFKKETNDKPDNVSNNDVKKWCAEAYKVKTENQANFPKEKVFKWCSLSGTPPNN